LGFLHGAGEQTEFVSFWVAQHYPADVGVLAHVDPSRTKSQKPLKFAGRGHAVSAQIQVQPVRNYARTVTEQVSATTVGGRRLTIPIR